MLSLPKFFDGIVLHPQVLTSIPELSDDLLTQFLRRSTYGFRRWLHWRLFNSERFSYFDQSMVCSILTRETFSYLLLTTCYLFNHQGVCYMTPRYIPTLSSLTQSATLLPQARMLNAIHAAYALDTDVESVPECISAKLPFSPASPPLLPFSISKTPLWMAFPSFQFTRAHQESSGF